MTLFGGLEKVKFGVPHNHRQSQPSKVKMRLGCAALLKCPSRVAAVVFRAQLSSFVPLASASFERPTPVVMVSAEGVGTDIWDSLALTLSSSGYAGTRIQHSSCRTFYDAADEIQRQITACKYTPPVLIAHSVATYAAQKFLESYPLSGLILVNPVAPFSAQRVIGALQSRWEESRQPHGESAEIKCLARYLGLPTSAQSTGAARLTSGPVATQPFLSSAEALTSFLNDVENPDAKVNLERGSVPTLIVTSDGDRALLTEEDISSLLELHAVAFEDALHFGTDPFPGCLNVSNRFSGASARAPMLTHTDEFNDALLDWIERVT